MQVVSMFKFLCAVALSKHRVLSRILIHSLKNHLVTLLVGLDQEVAVTSFDDFVHHRCRLPLFLGSVTHHTVSLLSVVTCFRDVADLSWWETSCRARALSC